MGDFNRNVYCVGGLPFDALDMNKALSALRNAKYQNQSCFMTTPNMNFLSIAIKDAAFLQSVIHSDIVIADGTPIIWMTKLLGIPIKHRIAGSSLFETLSKETRRKMKVYFLGGLDGVAKEASTQLNNNSKALSCVGYYSPGFGSIEEMSTDQIINDINSSNADFLVVALGARKGQAWILRNIHKITIPLVSHLGAVINFEAKRVKRAPVYIQEAGFEWLWRIKEEPALWKRYFNDGIFFSKLLVKNILPFALWLRLNKARLHQLAQTSKVSMVTDQQKIVFSVKGVVLDPATQEIRDLFSQACHESKNMLLDFSETEYVGFSFLGLVLLLKKHLDKAGCQLKMVNLSPTMKKIIDWNGLSFLTV